MYFLMFHLRLLSQSLIFYRATRFAPHSDDLAARPTAMVESHAGDVVSDFVSGRHVSV